MGQDVFFLLVKAALFVHQMTLTGNSLRSGPRGTSSLCCFAIVLTTDTMLYSLDVDLEFLQPLDVDPLSCADYRYNVILT